MLILTHTPSLPPAFPPHRPPSFPGSFRRLPPLPPTPSLPLSDIAQICPALVNSYALSVFVFFFRLCSLYGVVLFDVFGVVVRFWFCSWFSFGWFFVFSCLPGMFFLLVLVSTLIYVCICCSHRDVASARAAAGRRQPRGACSRPSPPAPLSP